MNFSKKNQELHKINFKNVSKNILFFLTFLFLLTTIQSQNTTEISIDSMLVDIDKAAFTTGILYDRVVPLANIGSYNDSVNISHLKYFEQALFELYKASNNQKFISTKNLRAFYTPDSLTNKVDIGVINASFHTVNYIENNENEGGLHYSIDKFEKINNNKPAFLPNHTFIVAPLKLYLVGDEIFYHFNNTFLLQDTEGKNIVNLVANFDTQTDYTLIENETIVNETIPITYTEEGYKTLTFTAIFTDGTTKTTQGILHVKLAQQLPLPDPLIESHSINSAMPFQGYDETIAILGRLDYRIFYHTNNGNNQATLLKPIIIIDGFDPGDRRKIQDSDPHPDQSNAEHRSIEEMMVYTNSNNESIDIIEELRVLGYDVVIVNHPTYWRNGIKIDGGADYIERNALTHVTLYQYINNILVQNNSAEELVIIGPSMGGLISRYALAYMEANNIPHNTRLWVSIDSPHLGANIPIGMQSLLDIVKDLNDDAQDFVDNYLGAPAAKQQLIEQFNGRNGDIIRQEYLNAKTISQGFNVNRGHPFYIQFYNNLFNNGLSNSNGYPQNLRKIALVNGSLTNTRAYDNPYEFNSVELSGTTTQDVFAGHTNKVLKIEGDANIIGHITTLESYFMPSAGNNHKIAYFKKKIFLGWNYKHRYITNNNSRGNMDNIPGGWFPTQQIFAKEIITSVPCEWFIGQICVNDWDIDVLKHVNSFIPTISSLGFKNPNFNWRQELDRNLVCTNEIPFDSYFGPKKNEQHTSFTEESVNWLLEELAGNPQSPTVYLDANDINGPNIVCLNDMVTYNFSSCKIGSPVQNWEVSNNLQIVTSNDSSVTVESTSSTSNSGFIRAIFPSYSIQKNIWLGKPNAPTYLNGPEEVNTGVIVTYSGGIAEGATSYEWWLPYPYDIVSPLDLFNDNWQTLPNMGRHNSQIFTGYAGNNGYVQLMGRNSCGLGGAGAAILYVENGSCSGPNCGDPPLIPPNPYPNSADSQFSLDFSSYPEGTYYIYIYDIFSNIMYQGESGNVEKTVNTLNIPEGLYYLHIHDGTNVIMKQLIIDH